MTGTADAAAHARARITLRSSTSSCTACTALGEGRHGPVPFRGPAPSTSRTMVLTDQPSLHDDDNRNLFTGADMKILATIFSANGLNLYRMTLASVICCHTDVEAKPPVRPTPDQTTVCIGRHLRPLIAHADPEWVVVLGKVALSVTHPTAKITRVHGKPFRCEIGPFHDRLIFPITHPSGAMTSVSRGRVHLASDVQVFAKVLATGWGGV